jgi:transposase-like protein
MAKQPAATSRTPRTLAQKLAALADFEARQGSVEEVATKHGVSTATLFSWHKLKKDGSLSEPGSAAVGKRPRASPDFRAKVLAEWRAGAKVADLAKKHDLAIDDVYRWSSREKRLAAKSPGTAIVKAANRHQQTVTFESPDGASLEVAVLRKRNEKLRRISRALVELLMEDL